MPIDHISKTIFESRSNGLLKQEALAAQVGCSRSYISKLEKGEIIPSVALATKLENALGLATGVLVKRIYQIKSKEAEVKKKMKEAVRAIRRGKTGR